MFNSDIAFKSDINRAFLPFVAGFMVFMAALVLATSMIGRNIADDWDGRLSGSLTVQVMPDLKAKNQAADMVSRIDGVRGIIAAAPGVGSYRVVSLEDTHDMLRPFLGDIRDFGLTVPRLITVEISRTIPLDLPRLKKAISDYSPLTRVESFDELIGPFQAALASARLLLGIIVILILATVGVTIAYATKFGLLNNANVIEVMHMVGANDRFISGQFSNQMTKSAILGGSGGFVFAVIAVFAIRYIAAGMDFGLGPRFGFGWIIYAYMAMIPIMAAVIAKVTALIVIRRTLMRWQ